MIFPKIEPWQTRGEYSVDTSINAHDGHPARARAAGVGATISIFDTRSSIDDACLVSLMVHVRMKILLAGYTPRATYLCFKLQPRSCNDGHGKAEKCCRKSSLHFVIPGVLFKQSVLFSRLASKGRS